MAETGGRDGRNRWPSSGETGGRFAPKYALGLNRMGYQISGSRSPDLMYLELYHIPEGRDVSLMMLNEEPNRKIAALKLTREQSSSSYSWTTGWYGGKNFSQPYQAYQVAEEVLALFADQPRITTSNPYSI